jgi:hypothetical protein
MFARLFGVKTFKKRLNRETAKSRPKVHWQSFSRIFRHSKYSKCTKTAWKVHQQTILRISALS